MKLYARTLLFFISTVVFQSVLTILFITGAVSKDNQYQARLEIHRESEYSYSRYNSWVRGLWGSIFVLKNDKYINNTISKTDHESANSLNRYLNRFMDNGSIDGVYIQNGKNGDLLITGNKSLDIPSSVFSYFKFDKNHPYIELRLINNIVYLTAIFQIKKEYNINIVLLKEINSDFYSLMTSSDKTIIFFSTDINSAKEKLGQKILMETLFHDNKKIVSYRESVGVPVGNKKYNISIRVIGDIHEMNDSKKLFLLLFIPNGPYEELLLRIREIVFYVSIFAGLLTIFLSIFFSRRITSFFNKLTSAMDSIRGGDYSVQVPDHSAYEVKSLMSGFNKMVKELKNNKEIMEDYIEQITFLNDYNETIFQSLNTGILIVNFDMTIEKVNNSFLNHFDCKESEIVGSSLDNKSLEIMDKILLGHIVKVNKGIESYFSKIVRTKTGVFEIKLYPLYGTATLKDKKCVVEIDDIAKKIELEEKIMQAEKLSSLSLLSAGISHEINNPLGSIMTNVQNLIAEEYSSEKREALVWIEQETKRIASIVRELLDFSSSESVRSSDGCDVNVCVKETIRIIEYGLKKENYINFILKLGDRLPFASVTKDELKQILINLIQNSIQAISTNGSIKILTEYDYKNNKIYLEVKDTGSGMDPEIIPHIFDPFFTTKGNGIGTGLGLSIVYGIIKKNNGSIDVRSTPGRGTIIKLILPVGEDQYEHINS